VLDEIMIELMYHLPEMDNVNAVYVLDEHAISERKPLSAIRRRAKESA
jgi:ATP-dependent protease Clp ATPase subunit